MLTVALLVTLASILFNDNWILSLQQQDAAISRTREITIELHKLCTELYHAESSQRGFLLMRQPQFLESYSAAAAETRKSINKINVLIDESPDDTISPQEQSLLTTLPQILDAKITEMQLTVSLAIKGNVQMSKQVVNLGKGTQDMESFIAQAKMLIEKQNQRIAALKEIVLAP